MTGADLGEVRELITRHARVGTIALLAKREEMRTARKSCYRTKSENPSSGQDP